MLRGNSALRRAVTHARTTRLTRKNLTEATWIGCHIASVLLHAYRHDNGAVTELANALKIPPVRSNTLLPLANRLVRFINHRGEDMSEKSTLNSCTFEARAAHILFVKEILTEEDAMAFFRVKRGSRGVAGIQGVCATHDDEGNEIPYAGPAEALLRNDIYDIGGNPEIRENDEVFEDIIASKQRLARFAISEGFPPLLEHRGLSIVIAHQIDAGVYDVIGDAGDILDEATRDLIIRSISL